MRASRLITYLVLATFFVGFFLFQITSCTKSVDAVTVIKKDTVYITKTDTVFKCPASIQGLWIGTYTVAQFPSQGSLYYSFIIKPNGVLLTESLGGNGATFYATGTWSLTGSSFTYSITSVSTGVRQTGSFVYNTTTGLLSSGTWQDVNSSANNTGAFAGMTKIN